MTAPDWDPEALPDLTGRTYLVTGATRGLGYFASEQLVRAGARVVMTGRNPNRLVSARAAVERRVPEAATVGPTETLLLDTSNLGSVRAAAATARARWNIDGVLLNAGVVHPPRTRETTYGGNEVVFATNVLGHFALAGALLTSLSAVAGRMVWVGSVAATISPYDPVDPQARRGLHALAGLCAVEGGVHLARARGRPPAAGGGRAGVERRRPPRLQHQRTDPGHPRGERAVALGALRRQPAGPVTQSKEEGAWPLVRALVDPTVGGGEFWGPRHLLRGRPAQQRPSKVTRDPEVAERLWRFCEETSGIHWP